MNKNILSNAIMFAAGAAVGSVVTWKLIKTKYEQLVQEEIESVREVYSRDKSDKDIEEDEEETDPDDESYDREEYEELVRGTGYVQYSQNKLKKEEDEDDMIEPYVIVPEEFDENGYETVTLFYFADGVLAYGDTNEVVKNVGELVCEDFEDHFGEYEPDSVFVRNDNLKTDFEILRDQRNYSEV